MRLTLLRFIGILLVAGLATLTWAYLEATSEPRIRRTNIRLDGWPPGQPNITIALISDVHVAGPDMAPARLKRIVAQVNALSPNLVFLTGDFVSDRVVSTQSYSLTEAIAPLRALRAPLGSYAVLGNHDHWRDAAGMTEALLHNGVRVLSNAVTQIGPLAVAGLDDDFTAHARLKPTLDQLATLEGASLILSHSPDPFPDVPDGSLLMLAGHTHCGQIVLPLIGAPTYMSRYGNRYACGLKREGDKTLITSAGVGTSLLPLRLGAPPEIWLVTLGAAGNRNPD